MDRGGPKNKQNKLMFGWVFNSYWSLNRPRSAQKLRSDSRYYTLLDAQLSTVQETTAAHAELRLRPVDHVSEVSEEVWM